MRSTAAQFSPSKHSLNVKLKPETGLVNRLFANRLCICLRNCFRKQHDLGSISSCFWDAKISQYFQSTDTKLEKTISWVEKRKMLLFLSRITTLANKSLPLSVYLQSWIYFCRYRDIIVRVFRLSHSTREHANIFFITN